METGTVVPRCWWVWRSRGVGGKMAKAAMSVGQKPGRAGGSSLIDGA